MNKYRKKAFDIQKTVKDVSREYLDITAYEVHKSSSSIYNENFVVVSGGNPFDAELDRRVSQLLDEKDYDDPEAM